MFNKWIETAKESATKLLSAGKTVLQDSVHTIQVASNEISEKANDFIRDSVVKAPDDMTYVTPNLIAMGFPGNPKTRNMDSKMNKANMTAYYLEARHPDHYMIFNLAEETYDTLLFHDRVMNYNFTGYPAPSLGLLIKICTNIEGWLAEDSENVAIVHCYDGKGRTMTICACVMTWLGWFDGTTEALTVALDRRGLSESVMTPAQLRYIQYFDSLLQGVRPSGEAFELKSVTVKGLPNMENGSCSPFVEVYNQSHLIYSSYIKGSKTRGTITPINAGGDMICEPSIPLRVPLLLYHDHQGNVFIRVRHISADNSKAITLFRTQFYTGFVKLFAVEMGSRDVDTCLSNSNLPENLHLSLQFKPCEIKGEMVDAYEALIMKETSALWSEVMRRKEKRMNHSEKKDSAFVVGTVRSSKKLNVEGEKPEEKRDYLNELSELENELKSLEVSKNDASTDIAVEAGTGEAMDLDKILENYQADMTTGEIDDIGDVDVENFNLNDYDDVLKNDAAEE